ncbi:MAG: DNA polymerase III subunit alpha, partial [Anaerolineales bacterium]
AAIRDVGRVKDIPLTDVDRIAKMIPAIPGKPITIPEALETVPALKEACDESPYLRELVDTAAKLEGVVRNAGTHAAGVIITDKLITDYVPLHRPTGGNLEENPIGSVTQFEMQILDDQGLLKVDFLGLSTLTVMARACKLIQERHGVDLDINSIPVDDPETFELLGRGDVLGVFQVEGVGMRRYLMDMKPRELANVIAMVALYRPGPMEFIPTYINRMHGNEKVSYPHPTLAKIFEETYGIPVYQEQIMFAAMELAGYSASEADSLRKAISKKKAKALGRHREKFILGAVEKGVEKATAVAVFDDWENFARYGFNKAHAADYGVIAVQTAYLKAHYALEYMTALLSVFKQDTDRVAIYVADCRRMAIDVLPPDINTSELDFAAQVNADGQAAIRFGLGAIKNVGHGPVQAILDARNEGGEFISLEDFARRTDLRMVGKRALESLIRVGALDHLASRIAMLEALDRIIAISSGYFRASEVGQLSFFGEATGVSDSLDIPKTLSNVPRRRLLAWEKELLGIYVSDHPLSPYLEELTKIVTHFSAELEETQQDQIVRVAGEITQIRPYQTRGGKAMGFVTLEDLQGQIELVIFTRVWKDAVRRLELDSIVVAEGKIDRDRGTPKILVDKISEEFKAFEARPMPVAQARPVRQDPDQNPPIERADQQPGNLAPSIDQPLQAAVQDEKPPLPIADAADEKPPLPRAGVADEIPAAFSETFEFSGYPARSNEPVTHSRLLAEVSDEIPVVSISTVNIGDDHTESEPKIITLMLDATGDRTRDALRMRRVHGLLNSYPGTDRFAFLLFEASHRYLLEFPSSSTGYCAELHAQLVELVGEHRIRIETLRYQ